MRFLIILAVSGAVLVGAAFLALGSDITAGYVFTPNDRVTSTKLNQLAGDPAVINPSFVSGKSSALPVTGDLFQFYQLTSGLLRQSSFGTLLLNNTNLIAGQTEDTAPQTNDFFLSYDVSANGLKKVTLGSIATNVSQLIFTNHVSMLTYTGELAGVQASNVFNITHGLPATPTWVHCVIFCRTTDAGYAVGDEIPSIDCKDNVGGSADTAGNPGLTVMANATTVVVTEGKPSMYVRSRVPAATWTQITYSKWFVKVYIRP